MPLNPVTTLPMAKADWDEDLHPRQPEGAPDGTGGQFAPKGGAEESDTGAAGAVSPKRTALCEGGFGPYPSGIYAVTDRHSTRAAERLCL